MKLKPTNAALPVVGWGQSFRQRYGARLLAGLAIAVFVLILRTLLLSLETLFIKFPGNLSFFHASSLQHLTRVS